jgi:lysophospholipase L1-like esterase
VGINVLKRNSTLKTILRAGIAVGVTWTVISGSASLQDQALQANDTIVFLGDSITQAGVNPDGYVTLTSEAIARAYPDLKIDVIGAGISGHKVPDCQKRLDRDVLQREPTLAVIYIGINDVWHWNRNQGTTKEDFDAGLREMISRIQSAGAKVILCTPTVIGEKTDGSNEFDRMLHEYADISRRIAKETGSQLLDLHEAFTDYLKEHNPDNAAKGILTTDGVHLNKQGNRFLSELVLDALNVPGAD